MILICSSQHRSEGAVRLPARQAPVLTVSTLPKGEKLVALAGSSGVW